MEKLAEQEYGERETMMVMIVHCTWALGFRATSFCDEDGRSEFLCASLPSEKYSLLTGGERTEGPEGCT